MTFQIGSISPAEYMRKHLKPIEQPLLANVSDPCAVIYNLVTNVQLDPERPLRLLKIQSLFPCTEMKSSFGAAILRFVRSLSKDQSLVPKLKAPSVTHLCFSKGALGSTGNRSEDEARLGCHEFRLLLYYNFGIRTNFRRFSVPNMVCSSSLDYKINLAAMYAENQVNTDFYPTLFPGLFYYYRYEYKDRQTIHQTLASGDSVKQPVNRKVTLLEDDLMHLHRHSNSTTRNESEEVVREQVRNMLNNYLPKYIYIVVLVFTGGKVVGLGPQDIQAANEAFKHVSEVAKSYRISDKEAAEFLKRKKAQDRVADKNKMLNKTNTTTTANGNKINYSNPLSKDLRKKMAQIANTVEDEALRKERVQKLLQEDLMKRHASKTSASAAVEESAKKKKKKSKEDDEDIDDFEDDGWDQVNKDMLNEMLEDGIEDDDAPGGGYGSDSSVTIPTVKTKNPDQDLSDNEGGPSQIHNALKSHQQHQRGVDLMSGLLASAEKGRKRPHQQQEEMNKSVVFRPRHASTPSESMDTFFNSESLYTMKPKKS